MLEASQYLILIITTMSLNESDDFGDASPLIMVSKLVLIYMTMLLVMTLIIRAMVRMILVMLVL